jgi:predicted AlkP superfamily pyrophosphatase or phosphodiesterase
MLPDYQGGSIVNLMSSIIAALGGDNSLYPQLRALDRSPLCQSRNLVLMVVDGLGYDFIISVGAHSTLARHVKARLTSVFPSTTATAITTFLTGLAPQQHALTGWHMYLRELDAVIAVLPFRLRGSEETLSRAGVKAAQLFDHTAVFDRIETQSHTLSPNRIVNSDFNIAHCGVAKRRGYDSLAELFDRLTAVIVEPGRKFVYAYFPDIDSLAHAHGIRSREVALRYAELDQQLDRLIDRACGTDTMLIVTADHGFIDSGPDRVIELSEHPQLSATLMLPLCGERRAAYCYVRPDGFQEFEHYVATRLGNFTDLRRSEELIEQDYFGLGAPHPELRRRIGDYTLLMKDNYVIKDWLPGERRHVHIGVHGGVSRQEMEVPLIIIEL